MKASYGRHEQRRDIRNDLPAGQLLIVDLISRDRGFRTFGIILNISKGGMAVQTFRPLAAGHVTEIRHCFSKTPLYTGSGQVVWRKEGGLAGLRFLNGQLKNLPELRQRASLQGPASDRPLLACRNTSSTDAFESTLHLLACSAMALTDAAGAAIVLGNSSVMQCRASAGIAPAVGTQLRPDSGLSGHSLRTQSIILCNDAWADSRVNVEAARQMDTRSILIVPITMAGSVVGLIEVFSPATNHFDERHVQRLEPLVTVLASVPEMETASADKLPQKPAEPMPIVAAQETGALPSVAQSVEAEVSAILAEIEKQPSEFAPTAEQEIETAEPDLTATASPAFQLPRSRPFPLAGGVISALLILLAAMAFFTYRLRNQSAEINRPTISPQGSQPSPAAIAAPSPEIAFDPAAVNQKVDASFGVNIVLRNAREILTVPLRIYYDPQKLRVITVASGGLFDRAGQPGTLDRRVDSAAGTIDLTISRPLSVPGASDSGALVKLTFVSKVSGHSRLQLAPFELHDSSNRVTLIPAADAPVEVSSVSTKSAATPATSATTPAKPATAPAKPATPPAKPATTPAKSTTTPATPTTGKKELPTQPAAPAATSAPQPPAESKAAPETPPAQSSSAAPEAPKQETGDLIMQGVPPGSEVWLDNQPFTATATTGKVAIRNVPHGTHHLRMSLHNVQYYDNLIDLKPGEIVNVEPQTSSLHGR
jgi:GAF domain/Cohesin domain